MFTGALILAFLLGMCATALVQSLVDRHWAMRTVTGRRERARRSPGRRAPRHLPAH